MEENIEPRIGRFKGLYLRVENYFKSVFNRDLRRRSRLLYAVKGLASLFLIAFVILFLYTIILIPFTPSTADLRKLKVDQPTILMSSDGKRLATYKQMNREWVPLNKVSPHVISALIATEDRRFYQHHGVDPKRIAAALVNTLMGDPEGGSTLTQQLARNLYPEDIGRQRSITRKIKEIITAFKIEHAYTKKEILETYLNTMPFLYNAFGIEMGARTYFDKPARQLNLLESATLIGMLKGTSYYNPVLNPERAVQRRNVVLAQMVKYGALSQAEFNRLKAKPLRLDFERQLESLGPAPHLAEHIRKWLVDWADRNDINIYADGLVVHTTVDSRLQSIANHAVSRQMEALQAVADVEWGLSSEKLISSSPSSYTALRSRVQPFGYFWNTKRNLVETFIRESAAYRNLLDNGTAPEAALAQLKKDAAFMAKLRAEKTRLQAGFVAIDPTTGDVKAWVGSRDFKSDQYDHVSLAQRQPGSTFKPFVYGAALEQGMSPNKQFIDQPIDIRLSNGSVWRPTDMSGATGRSMTAREGLMYSKNTITAQVMMEVGPKKTADFARRMGITQSKLDEVPALALGPSPVTLLEMVSAYSTIAANGEYRQPNLITHITDKRGNVLVEFQSKTKRAVAQETAEILIDMMRGAVDRGTATAVRTRFSVRADVAGKTGTTQNNTDGWFILMHPRIVAGSWVGFNDARINMRSNYWGQGGHNALLIVGDFFRQALNSKLVDINAQFPRPRGSIFGPWLDRFEEWWRGEPAQQPPASDWPNPEEQHETPPDDVERIVNEAREAERTYEIERRRVEGIMEESGRIVKDIRREIQGSNTLPPRREPVPQSDVPAYPEDAEDETQSEPNTMNDGSTQETQ